MPWIIRVDGSFHPERRTPFDPIDYETSWTNPLLRESRMGAAALVYRDDQLVGLKTTYLQGGNSLQAETLALLLGLSAVADLGRLLGAEPWRRTLREGVQRYMTSKKLLPADRPSLCLIEAESGGMKKSALREGLLAVYDIKQELERLGIDSQEIASVTNHVDETAHLDFSRPNDIQYIVHKCSDKKLKNLDPLSIAQIHFQEEATRFLHRRFQIISDHRDLIGKIWSEAGGPLPLQRIREFTLREAGVAFLDSKSAAHVLGKYLNRSNLSWQKSNKESLEHRWANLAARLKLRQESLEIARSDLAEREAFALEESLVIAEELKETREVFSHEGLSSLLTSKK